MFGKFIYCLVIGIGLSTIAAASRSSEPAGLEDFAPVEALRREGRVADAVALLDSISSGGSSESEPLWDRYTQMAFCKVPDGRAVEFWVIRAGLSMAQRETFVTMFDILGVVKKTRNAPLAEDASISFSARSVGTSIKSDTLEKLVQLGLALCRRVTDVEKLARRMTDTILQESKTFGVHNNICDLYNEKAIRSEGGTLEPCQLFSEENARRSLEHIMSNITEPGAYASDAIRWLDRAGPFSKNFFSRDMRELRGNVYDEKYDALKAKVDGFRRSGAASSRTLDAASMLERMGRRAFGRYLEEDASETPTSAEDLAKAAWTETFTTRVGEISHTPEGIQWGGIFSGKELALRSAMVNGVPLRAPLILKRFSTREEFIEAMRVAGII